MTGDEFDLFTPRDPRGGTGSGGSAGVAGAVGAVGDDLEARLRLALRSDPPVPADLVRVIRTGRARGSRLRRRRQRLTMLGTALAVALVAGVTARVTLPLTGSRDGSRDGGRVAAGGGSPSSASTSPPTATLSSTAPPASTSASGAASGPLADGPAVPGVHGYPRSVAVSADGRRLAVSSDGGAHVRDPSLVRIFDLADPAAPTERGRIELPSDGWAESVALSPDGSVLVTGQAGGAIRLYDLTDPAQPRLAQTLPATTSFVTSVVFSPDGGLLATAGYDDTLRLWRMTGPRAAAAGAFRHKAGDLMALAFDRDGARVAAASYHRVTVWALGSAGTGPVEAHVVAEVPASSVGLMDVGFSADRLLVADGDVRVWDLAASGGPRQTARLKRAGVSLAVSPDGDRFAVQHFVLKQDGPGDATVTLWTLPADGVPVRDRVAGTPTGMEGDDRGLAWLPDGRGLYATTSGGGTDLISAP